MSKYTHWRVYKEETGRWYAKNYSLADGFIYTLKGFDSHTEAIAHVIKKATA